MKKLLLAVCALFGFIACTQNPIEEQSTIRTDAPETIKVGFEDDETRIQLNEAHKTVWTKDDLVSVFYKSNANQKWEYRGETGERVAELYRVDAGTASSTMNYVVLAYPYSTDYVISTATGNIEATLPATQHYAAGSYGVGENLMVSRSEFTQFSLKSVCGWLKLQLTGDGEVVNSIKFRGNNSEQVAGLIYVDTETAEATLASKMGDDEDNNVGGNLIFDDTILTEVTLDCGTGVTLGAESTSFYIVLPPQTFTNGFTVEIECDGYKPMTLSTENELVIERNTIQPMASVKHNATLIIPNNEIWYTNGSATEATTPYKADVFGANIVSNTYDAKKGWWVIKFDGDVTTIGEWAFSGRSALTSVAIPKSITAVEKGAFYGCESLTSVYISDMSAWCKINFDTTIGNLSHYAKNLYLDNELVIDLIIPSDITEIKYGTFINSDNLISVTIPDSLTTIAEGAFNGCCNLTEFKGKYASKDGRCLIIDGTLVAFARAGLIEYSIPESVTTIGNYAFSNCSNIINLTIPDSVTAIGDRVFSNCSNIEHLILPSSITSMGEYAWAGCGGKIKINCILPGGENSSIDGTFKDAAFTEVVFDESVTSIGEYLFHNCDKLTNVVIPEGVETIKGHAFQNCDAITNITIPNSVTSIGSYIFDYCTSLTTVNIGKGVKRIPYCAFCGCSSLVNMTIPEYIDSIDDEAFYRCNNMESVIIENGVTSIGWDAFGYCTSLTNINIPDSVTSIEVRAFENCGNLASVTLPNNITEIEDYVFYGCSSLTNITIPDRVNRIGDHTFYGCSSLTNITIPESVTNIADSAFEQCSSLTSITIPSRVYNIGSCAFKNCNNLRSVECKATTPPWVYSDSFYNNASGRKIYVPIGSVGAYRSDWKAYQYDIVGVTFN